MRTGDAISRFVKRAIEAQAGLHPRDFTEGDVLTIVRNMAGGQGESVGEMLHEIKEFWPFFELDRRLTRDVRHEIQVQLRSARDRIAAGPPPIYVRKFACVGDHHWAIFRFLTRNRLLAQHARHEYMAHTNARMAEIEAMFLEELEGRPRSTVQDVWLVVAERAAERFAIGAA